MAWDVFCRVVDNYGDIGVCWRLAADLAARGEAVRLVVDDAGALAWMAPHGAAGVTVVPWDDGLAEIEPADVVVEAFGCDPPPAYVAAMSRRRPAPVWINLEYLSAEAVVERNHGLTSPQSSGPGRGLVKHFYYPGFTHSTGGLLREPDLLARQHRFVGDAWIAARGGPRREGEQVVSLFCYDNPAIAALVAALAARPTRLLVSPGPAVATLRAVLGDGLQRGALRAVELPFLDQREFDHLLWACDLNFVRGEDSFVRAQWAARPFVWHIYPQGDGVHRTKLDAFLGRHLATADAATAAPLRAAWAAWNGFGPVEGLVPEPTAAWRELTRRWRDGLLAQADLASQLIGFVAERR